jgi:hypothetical protein
MHAQHGVTLWSVAQGHIDAIDAIANLLEFGGEAIHPAVRQYDEARLVANVVALEQLIEQALEEGPSPTHGIASTHPVM